MAIYMDHAATTPITDPVLAEFNKQLKQLGNPSSLHAYGRETRRALEESREKIANFLKCQPSEIIFTASGTEADNLAIKGLFGALKEKSSWFLVSNTMRSWIQLSGWLKKKVPS